MTKLPQFTLDKIGQDTEFFLWNEKKGEVVPSFKYFKQKENAPALRMWDRWAPTNPKGVEYIKLRPGFTHTPFTMYSGGAVKVFRDGLAVELNSDPVTCRAWLWQDNKLALALAISKCWPRRKPKHLRFTSRPCVDVTPEMLATFPKDLLVLGCHPTYDAYKQTMKTPNVDPKKLPFRTCGAHLHSSFFGNLPEECWAPIAKLGDLLMGAPFTYIYGDTLEYKRRSLYGQAGEFRYQVYPNQEGSPRTGVEYRVLSSRLYNHPGPFGLFTGIWKYVILPNYAELWEAWDPAWEDDLQEAINLGTPAALEKVLPLSAKLLSNVGTAYTIKWKEAPSKEIPAVWKKLRALNEEGAFPDAGIINTHFPEAHYGWND